MSPPQRRGLAVRAEEDSGQDDLDVTRINQPPGFFDRVVDRLVPEAGAQLWDDAVRAMRITPVLHLQERALVAGPVGTEAIADR